MIVDPLSRTMLVVVNTIAPLVFIYSIGYMAHEEGYWRYFAGLALFLFSMLGIVLANNFVMMFIFWELVGVSSYILIGHYYGRLRRGSLQKPLLSIGSAIWSLCSAFSCFGMPPVGGLRRDFAKVPLLESKPLSEHRLYPGVLRRSGKSAQLPLHVWLPNSMEGPTRFPRCSMRRRWWRRGSICGAAFSAFWLRRLPGT